MKEFVSKYRLNLYDCHEHNTFDEYKTGLRRLFEVVRYGRDKEDLGRIFQENREAYSRLDDDTRELIEVIAKVRVGEEYEIVEDAFDELLDAQEYDELIGEEDLEDLE